MSARTRLATILAAAGLCGLALAVPVGPPKGAQDVLPAEPLEKTVSVAGEAGWVDTAVDVRAGEEIKFSATGEVLLQKGNPGAICGPGGLDLLTADQPVPDANLGALIGKVVQIVSRRVDEDSGVEVCDEIFVLFVIGPEGAVTAPFKGRLYLGINENVVRDNGGAFTVVVRRQPS